MAAYILPDITGRTAEAVRPDGLNAKYHVRTSATYSRHNRDPVQAKFTHVTNIETCALLWLVGCLNSLLWLGAPRQVLVVTLQY